ncbi:DUF6925 family protein [Methylobacterium platani]|uniref:Uncharacterized protein n=2 Tax=Methylobacterium platani TaxID=427683 RepID=A0A179S5H2_9HYPH|nr:hypothetical protein [Methylobacterium platani]KMO17944.1 hypothetical protein SQ03_11235 [Methylobacterium platani JCM 14648]OAS19635.1 hypothetical protein A5481_24725 [Methylobacterium platani]
MSPPPDRAALRAVLARALADPAAAWSLGGYGAGATFRRAPGEPADLPCGGRPGLVTPRGALVLEGADALMPVAYETALGAGAWSHALALCRPVSLLPPCPAPALRELGPDAGAARAGDRDGVLFCLGLPLRQARLLVRVRGEAVRGMRAACGRPADAAVWAALPGLGAVLVAAHARARIEVVLPDAHPGPRALWFDKLLRQGRLHAATAAIPPGLAPVIHLHPPHPLTEGGDDPGRHAAFQALLARWGDPALVALKRRLLAGEAVSVPDTRAARGVARVAQAQRRWLETADGAG